MRVVGNADATLGGHSTGNTRWILAGIVIVAISLRLWGINFGLPNLYHADEPDYVTIAQDIFKTGELNPRTFRYPSLFFYINALSYVPYYFVGKLAGVFQTPFDIPAPMKVGMGIGQTSLPSTFLLGRSLTATFGSAAVILVFLIGQQIANRIWGGLLAALMIAISPTSVANSRFIRPDTYMVFFTLLVFWTSAQILCRNKTRYYILAGIACGLTASTKYNGALIMLTVVLAHFLRCGFAGLKDRRLYLVPILSFITFLATTPYALLDSQRFLADIQIEYSHYSTGHPGMEGDSGNWYLSYLWQVEGPLVAALAVGQILYGFRASSKSVLLLSSFPVLYFGFISRFVVRNDSTLLPLIPFLFLLASSMVINMNDMAATRLLGGHKTLASTLGVLILMTLLAVPLLQTVKSAVQLDSVDSREIGRIWANQNLPKGARIALESYSPYLAPQEFNVQSVTRAIDHPPDWYKANGFEYLIVSQGMFGRFYREPDKYAGEISQYEALFRSFELVKRFSEGNYEVRIYRVTR